MQVVYTPAHLGHDITRRDVHGPGDPGERGRRAGRDHPRDARRRRRLRRGPSRPSTARRRSPRSTTRASSAFLEVAWSEVRRQQLAGAVPVRRHVPQPRDVRGHERRGDRARSCASRSTSAAGPGYWGLDSAAPLVAGTYVAARGAVDVALTTVDLVLGGAHGRLRPVPAARPPRRPLDVRRLLLLQQRRDRGRGDHRGDRRAGRDPRRRLPPRQRHASRSSGGAATCATSRSTPTRSAPTRTSSGRADETGRGGRAPARTSTSRSAPAPRTRTTSRRRTGRSRRSRPCPAPSSSSRSASTRTGSTRSATSRSRPTSTTRSAGGSPRSAGGS